MIKSGRAFHFKLTTGFIFLYFFVMFFVMALTIGIYVKETGDREALLNRQKTQEALQHTANELSYSFSAGKRAAFSINTDTLFRQFLNGNFPSPQSELNAFSSHMKPMLNALVLTNPYIHSMYVYREQRTFLGSGGFLTLLADLSELPYDFDPEMEENTVLLIMNKEDLYCPLSAEAPDTPCVVCLSNLYGSGYSSVKGILEVQICLEDILALIGDTQEMYLYSEDFFYHVLWENNRPVFAQAALDREQINESNGWVVCQVADTKYQIMRKAAYPAGARGMMSILIPLAGFSIVASAFFCLIIFRYTKRIRQLCRHIRKYKNVLPGQYQQKTIFADEVDDLIHAYDEQVETIHTLIEQAALAEHNQKEAYYYAKHSQIKPHFLFNTLENIRMQIELNETREAAHMLYALGQLMQYNMSFRSESTLAEELQHISYYLNIFSLRMRSALTYQVDNQTAYRKILCPSYILQPIVENCIRHGYRGKGTVLHVRVTVQIQEDMVWIDVMDDGKGMEPEEMEKLNKKLAEGEDHDEESHHIGLFNVNARIRYLFGRECGVVLSENAGQGGLKCSLKIMKQERQSKPLWADERGAERHEGFAG